MNESRIYTKQNLRGSRTHSLTGWSEQQNIREDKTIGRLLHRCLHVRLLLHIYTLRSLVKGENSQIPKGLDTMISIVDGKTRALEPMLIIWLRHHFQKVSEKYL